MKILDIIIDSMVNQLVGVDDDSVMNRNEWHNFCSSAVERNITKDEFDKELAEILNVKR